MLSDLYLSSRGLCGDEERDGPITELRTVKQQLALIRKRQQTHTVCSEPYTLKLDERQKARLQQQLQQVETHRDRSIRASHLDENSEVL